MGFRKCYKSIFTVIITMILFIFPVMVGEAVAADTPRLYNELPAYLQGFKATVERQALKYPDTFYLNSFTDEKVVALTFDDGPDQVNTPAVLDILKEKGVIATFFLVGDKVEEFPDITRRIKREGHQLANHSWSHQDLRKISNQDILDKEIYPTSRLIERLTGTYLRYFRPPYGAIKDEMIELLSEKGWMITNWSIDSFDWDSTQNSPAEVIDKVERYIHPGAVILMHSGEINSSTSKALPEIISSLREKGYQFKTIEELFLRVEL